MKKVKLIRVEQGTEATLGVMLVEGRSVCWSLEEPWRNNRTDVSCIPQGRYPLRLEFSPSRGCELWTIKDVPHRSYVRIHKGNTVDDTQGCPLTGSRPGYLNGKRAVLGSRDGFREFMNAMSGSSQAEIDIISISGLSESEIQSQ
ncbi:DUF5675 family protein [Desulfovibrio sp. JC010]|uniref:DUF5675 family protein n=1 Tax=Desulfovibrio sp. JC010 TaxID=2593641 RepID=UPI0013D1D495|nr:DUF5675 family protein [Desulfovibrio sp. JC010]NDV28591.1 hypothetical protein [Desulfovibrio sp. JC010]